MTTLELEPGEDVLVRAPLHLLRRFPNLGFSACVVGVVALVVARNELAASTVALLGAAAAVIVVISSVVPSLRRRGFELVVTTRRIAVRTAHGRVRVFERRRLREVAVEQGWWGGLVGYGSVGIVPTDGPGELFAGVAGPDALRAALGRQPTGSGRRR